LTTSRVLLSILQTAHFVGTSQLRGRSVTTLIWLGAIAAFLPAQAQLPHARLSTIFPPGGRMGTTVDVTISGADLDEATQLQFSHSNITAKAKLSEQTSEPEPNRFLVA